MLICIAQVCEDIGWSVHVLVCPERSYPQESKVLVTKHGRCLCYDSLSTWACGMLISICLIYLLMLSACTQVLVCPEKSYPQENKDKILLGYTAMVDAWAMGILAYELIVGHPPFEKESRAATYEHIMFRKPGFPAWISDEAREFIVTALTKVGPATRAA